MQAHAARTADARLFRTIICGVDASSASLDAVGQVLRLAAPGGALVIVAVCESYLAVHAGMHANQVAAELEAEAAAALEQARGLADDAETLLVHGRAADTLLRIAREKEATLVAVGSHGTGRGVGLFLGSVASRLLHEAPCSVLVARPASDLAGFPGSIVVGLDGSPPSLEAAAVGQGLAERLGAQATFLTATGGRRSDLNADALATSGFEPSYNNAKPLPALLDASSRADVLVIGARGVRGLRALGSVSERVAHRAGCTVLVVREPR
jgi:nucleotide-binding universal stress UspA family protein